MPPRRLSAAQAGVERAAQAVRRRGRAVARGTAAALRALPRPLRRLLAVALVASLVVLAFVGVVLPLFHPGAGGSPSAELTGSIPDATVAGRPLSLDLAIDNSGGVGVDPICVRADFRGPVRVDDVVFQGLDHVPVRDRLACGGKLNGDETISVRLTLVAPSPGRIAVDLRPAEGSRLIGPGIRGTITVTAP